MAVNWREVARQRALVGLLAAVCAVAPRAAEAQGPATKAVMQDGNEVRLTIPKTEILVGEPIFLLVTVTNRECEFVFGNFQSRLNFPEGSDLEVRIRPPGELPYRFKGTDMPVLYPVTELDLASGQNRVIELPIIYDPSQEAGYVFGSPGEYEVSAKLTFAVLRQQSRHAVELPPTRIRVVAPEGDAAQAWSLIGSRKTGELLQKMYVDDEAVAEALGTVAERYGDTPYAPLASFLSAAAFFNSERENLPETIEKLKVYLQRYPRHEKYGAAIFLIFTSYDRMGQFEAAQGWYYFLLDMVPNYNLVRAENVLSNAYYIENQEGAQGSAWWRYERPWVSLNPPMHKRMGYR